MFMNNDGRGLGGSAHIAVPGGGEPAAYRAKAGAFAGKIRQIPLDGERGACDPRACGRGRTQRVFQQSILGVRCVDTSCALVRLRVQAHRVRVREWMRLKWKTANPADASAPRGGGQSQPAGSRSPRPGAAPRARRRKAIAGKQSAGQTNQRRRRAEAINDEHITRPLASQGGSPGRPTPAQSLRERCIVGDQVINPRADTFGERRFQRDCS